MLLLYSAIIKKYQILHSPNIEALPLPLGKGWGWASFSSLGEEMPIGRDGLFPFP
jgi:hypothetical protein